jgi:hypothetical protein
MRRVAWIGALGLLALIGVWFYATFERVPGRTRVPPSAEAQLRPFLAAQRFAERMGMRTQELRGLPDLDALPAGGVLLLPPVRQALNGPRILALLAWTERGGHLVVEAEPAGRADPLLDVLALRRTRRGTAKPLVVDLPDGRKLSVALPGPQLEGAVRNPLLSAGSAEAWRLVSFRRGKGVVTVASSLDFARNDFAGDLDHAELLWAVLQLSPASELRVFARPQKLSLWGFLEEHAAPALLGGGLLLGVWLWRTAPRFGPLVPDAPPARRRLLDHLRASGRYFWARGQRARLLAAARDAALRRIARSQPDFAVATEAERAMRLARLADVAPRDAAHFLATPAEPQGTLPGGIFIDLVRVAQRVHAALDRGKTT